MLLAAAAEEFAERGLDASVADIARRAGIGKGTVFRHFPTKDDLITAIVTERRVVRPPEHPAAVLDEEEA